MALRLLTSALPRPKLTDADAIAIVERHLRNHGANDIKRSDTKCCCRIKSLCEKGDTTPRITGPVPFFAQTLNTSLYDGCDLLLKLAMDFRAAFGELPDF